MSMNARKAAVLIENAAIEVQDRPYLAPADDEVEVAISRAGVCSSDIERGFNHGHATRQIHLMLRALCSKDNAKFV